MEPPGRDRRQVLAGEQDLIALKNQIIGEADLCLIKRAVIECQPGGQLKKGVVGDGELLHVARALGREAYATPTVHENVPLECHVSQGSLERHMPAWPGEAAFLDAHPGCRQRGGADDDDANFAAVDIEVAQHDRPLLRAARPGPEHQAA